MPSELNSTFFVPNQPSFLFLPCKFSLGTSSEEQLRLTRFGNVQVLQNGLMDRVVTLVELFMSIPFYIPKKDLYESIRLSRRNINKICSWYNMKISVSCYSGYGTLYTDI